MEPLTDCPAEIAGLAFTPAANIRWSWKEQRAYKITNTSLYRSRFQPFNDFLAAFYEQLEFSPIIEAHENLFFAEYPKLGIAIVGLPSWDGNDCYCHVGHISSATLACAQKLIANSIAEVVVAVWHHGIVGSPDRMDYMDQRVVHKLIDYGCQVGLHGHQHHPGAAPYALNLPNSTSIIVIGAGSFAVGDRELPMGEHRQFNLVRISRRDKTVTTHVRAMSSSGVFARSHRDDFGGNAFITLPLPPRRVPHKAQVLQSAVLADDVVAALGERRYDDVITLTSRLDDSYASLRRKAKIKAYEALEEYESLIALLDPPQRPDEAIKLTALLIRLGRWDAAEAQLDSSTNLIPKAFSDDFRDRIAAGRLLQ